MRGIQRGTLVRKASYSPPNVCSSVGSSYATTNKWKASQNRNAADRAGVIAGLGDDPMAQVVGDA